MEGFSASQVRAIINAQYRVSQKKNTILNGYNFFNILGR